MVDREAISQSVQKAQEGDDQALEELLDLIHRPLMDRALRFYNGNFHQAEELVEEVRIKIWEKLPYLNPDGNILAWCKTIAKNMFVDELRKPRIGKIVYFYDEDGQPKFLNLQDNEIPVENQAAANEVAQIVQDAIDQLPPRQRTVMNQRGIIGFSNQDVAIKTRSTEPTISALYHRGINNLRKILNTQSFD